MQKEYRVLKHELCLVYELHPFSSMKRGVCILTVFWLVLGGVTLWGDGDSVDSETQEPLRTRAQRMRDERFVTDLADELGLERPSFPLKPRRKLVMSPLEKIYHADKASDFFSGLEYFMDNPEEWQNQRVDLAQVESQVKRFESPLRTTTFNEKISGYFRERSSKMDSIPGLRELLFSEWLRLDSDFLADSQLKEKVGVAEGLKRQGKFPEKHAKALLAVKAHLLYNGFHVRGLGENSLRSKWRTLVPADAAEAEVFWRLFRGKLELYHHNWEWALERARENGLGWWGRRVLQRLQSGKPAFPPIGFVRRTLGKVAALASIATCGLLERFSD